MGRNSAAPFVALICRDLDSRLLRHAQPLSAGAEIIRHLQRIRSTVRNFIFCGNLESRCSAFSLAPSLGLVDIRFLPFAQIMLVLLGAVGWGRLLSRLPRPNLWLAAFCAGIVALALTRAAAVDSWIQWNYSGMESKPLWNSYRLVNEYLSGDENSPRVVYEHNEITNGAGSVRAFELLPYYSGRSTLEGLYMQSSPNSPFVFYIQSELTQTPSTPFSRYYYSRPDPEPRGRSSASVQRQPGYRGLRQYRQCAGLSRPITSLASPSRPTGFIASKNVPIPTWSR